MSKLLSVIVLIFCYISTYTQITTPVPEFNNVQSKLLSIINDESLVNASIGFYAVDMKTHDVVAEYKPEQSLVPASTLKLVTTSAALEILGKNFRFKTIIQYSGKIDSTGNLKGNIYIKGGGDPALGSKLFEKNYYQPFFLDIWSDSIKALQISSIDGRIIADASIFKENVVPATWIWGDIANYYGAAAYGISVYENTYKIFFKSGKSHGDSTEITNIKPTVNINFKNTVLSSDINKDKAYIYGAPYDNYRYIEGTIPKNKKDFVVKGAIPDPPYFIAQELNNMLDSNGIKIKKTPATLRILNITNDTIKRTDICTTLSPYLKSIIYWTNLKSNNLFAEHLLKYIGYIKYSTGDNVSGTKAVKEFWKSKGINTSGMYLNDGSGLSRYNAITAKQLVDILQYMRNKSPNYETINKSLPVAGKTGTLSLMCRGEKAQGRIRAKSGTMARVKSYAGYVTTINNKELAFAIIVNNYNGSSIKLKRKIEELFNELAVY